jgi:hypothetical protein
MEAEQDSSCAQRAGPERECGAETRKVPAKPANIRKIEYNWANGHLRRFLLLL